MLERMIDLYSHETAIDPAVLRRKTYSRKINLAPQQQQVSSMTLAITSALSNQS